MRKVLHVTAVAAAGLALLACNRPPERQAVAYAPPPAQTYGNGSYAHVGMPPALPPRTYGGAPYGRADVPPQVPPPRAYDGAPYGRADVPPQVPPPHAYNGAPYGRADVPPQVPPPHADDGASYERADVPQQDQRLVWKSSPRWATVKGEANAPAVKRVSQTKFKDAQAKAEKVGVENLTGEDIAGLTPAQIKQLRGY